jgi:glycosyltransferase involved in cell wall biosynthesis
VIAEPLVTAIIPTYNRAALVCAAIESVRQQSYGNVEIILVDDGSTDDTQVRLKAYGDSVRVIVQDNAGPAAARNRGIEAARGGIVAFLDSDDIWRPTKLERQVRLLQKAGDRIVCCLCNATMVFPDGRKETTFQDSKLAPAFEEGIWQNVAEVLATRFVLFSQAVLIRRKTLEKVGGFDERLRILEDYDLAFRLSLEGPWAYIREPLVDWQQASPGSMTQIAYSDQLRLRECIVQMWQSLWERIEEGARHQHLRKRVLGELREAGRLLRATQLSQKKGWTNLVLAQMLFRLERYRSAIYRRSPWYPRMEVAPINGSSSLHQ